MAWFAMMFSFLVCLSLMGRCVASEDIYSSGFGSGEMEEEFVDDDMKNYCLSHRNASVRNRTVELDCCRILRDNFRAKWFLGRVLLTEYLTTLENWNCPQFFAECKNRTFAFNTFARTVYNRACSPGKFRKNCFRDVQRFVYGDGAVNSKQENFSVAAWQDMLSYLRDNATTSDSLPACVQVAMYDSVAPFGQYHEMVSVHLPFCGITWCGMNARIPGSGGVSLWACMSRGCRSAFVTAIVFVGVIAVITTTANVCVVTVFCRNKALRNSQGVYKLSLGFADSMVGLVILPTFCYTLSIIALQEHRVEKAAAMPSNHSSVPYVSYSGFNQIFNKGYLTFVGYWTTVFLAISIYTLLLASLDRLSVVRNPFDYKPHSAKKFACKAVVAVWVTASLLSTIPLYAPTLKFSIVSGTLVASSGTKALYVYLINFFIPLVLMWTVTIATCCYTFCHAREREAHEYKAEMQLSRVLIMMVTVFTLGVAPVFVSIAGALLLPGIYFQSPTTLNLTTAAAYVSFEFVAVVCLVCNSSWNFFIYNARSKSFRKSTRSLMAEITETTRGFGRGGTVSTRVSSLRRASRHLFSRKSKTSPSNASKA